MSISLKNDAGTFSTNINQSNPTANVNIALPTTSGTMAMTTDAKTSGNVVLGSGSLGYGVGNGGTVTQATSKSTSVALNKLSGKVTTHDASLAAGVVTTFLVNNSTITVNDVVVVSLAAVGTVSDLSTYEVQSKWISDGAFYIALKNISGVSKSEAVAINFIVIKGAIT